MLNQQIHMWHWKSLWFVQLLSLKYKIVRMSNSFIVGFMMAYIASTVDLFGLVSCNKKGFPTLRLPALVSKLLHLQE
jgi:hypothetical protein